MPLKDIGIRKQNNLKWNPRAKHQSNRKSPKSKTSIKQKIAKKDTKPLKKEPYSNHVPQVLQTNNLKTQNPLDPPHLDLNLKNILASCIMFTPLPWTQNHSHWIPDSPKQTLINQRPPWPRFNLSKPRTLPPF